MFPLVLLLITWGSALSVEGRVHPDVRSSRGVRYPDSPSDLLSCFATEVGVLARRNGFAVSGVISLVLRHLRVHWAPPSESNELSVAKPSNKSATLCNKDLPSSLRHPGSISLPHRRQEGLANLCNSWTTILILILLHSARKLRQQLQATCLVSENPSTRRQLNPASPAKM